MRIDSHQHFWKAERGDYFWMNPSVAILCRDYLLEDLAPHLARHQIEKTVLVQAAQTVAETDYMLGLAAENPFVAGVVGWLELDSADFGRQLDRYCENPRFIGLRPMLQDLPDDDWILRPRVLESLRLVAERDLPFDFLVLPWRLPYVLQALEEVPGLRALIDHIAKPNIAAQQKEPWQSSIAEVAEYPNVCCKLAGLVTQANHASWTPQDLQPYVDHVIECFGLDRLMFGTDWPVCLLAGSYDEVIGALQQVLVTYLDERTEAAVFGGNAARFYKLEAKA